MKYLKNTVTGAIFGYTEILAARKIMAPCDSRGRRVYEGDEEEAEPVVVKVKPVADLDEFEPNAPVAPKKKKAPKKKD